jgi:aminopeptidase N
MHEYVSQFRWRIATPDDFLEVAESISGRDLDPLFNRWILGKQ